MFGQKSLSVYIREICLKSWSKEKCKWKTFQFRLKRNGVQTRLERTKSHVLWCKKITRLVLEEEKTKIGNNSFLFGGRRKERALMALLYPFHSCCCHSLSIKPSLTWRAQGRGGGRARVRHDPWVRIPGVDEKAGGEYAVRLLEYVCGFSYESNILKKTMSGQLSTF